MKKSRFLRTSALAALLSLPTLACDPPPAVNPDEATPATDATATDVPEGQTADANADAATPAAETPAKPGVDQSNLPEAEAVLAKNVDAVGGQAKIDAIKSYYSESVMEIASQNIKISNKMWWQGGDFYAEAEMPGMGVTKIWKVGEALWSEDPINGLRPIEGKEAAQQLRSNELVLSATWKKHFASAKTTERRMVDDKPVIDVLLATADGDEVTMSFAEDSGLLIEQAFVQESPQGNIPVRMHVDEYGDYDGFKSANKSTMDMTVAKITSSVTKFDLNAKIDKKKFKLPEGAKSKGPSKVKAKK